MFFRRTAAQLLASFTAGTLLGLVICDYILPSLSHEAAIESQLDYGPFWRGTPWALFVFRLLFEFLTRYVLGDCVNPSVY